MAYHTGVPKDPNLLAQTIGSNIQKITQQTSEIQRIVNQLGTPQDSTDLRQTLQQKQQYVNHLAKETDKFVKEFGSLPAITEQRQLKLQRDRLVNDFSSALVVFQKIQRQATQKEKDFVARVRASSSLSSGPDDNFGGIASPFESQVQPQAQEEAFVEGDLQLIQERERSIRQLESDISGINEIFKDLGMMIHEQGDMIDSIEANVENADVSVQSATQQLERAANYQQKSRKKLCIIIIILVILAVVIGVIIYASVKS